MSIFHFFSKEKQHQTDQEKSRTTFSPIKNSFWTQLNKAILGKTRVDAAVIDKLEELLIAADMGIPTTLKIIEQLEARITREKYLDMQELATMLQAEIIHLLTLSPQAIPKPVSQQPYIILVVGVNGVGKTTTIGKLAARYKAEGKKVILGAADTFRAAAIQQLQHWSEQVGVNIITPTQHADPSAVAYETVQQAIATKTDIAIIDTAGRLHTKINLMQELAKIRRTIEKQIPGAPHEVLLVLDATTGQNAFAQTKAFTQATAVNGLVVTKLDGTAKGGVVIGIIDQFQVPVKYIGVGEQLEDLQLFDEKKFTEALFRQSEPFQPG